VIENLLYVCSIIVIFGLMTLLRIFTTHIWHIILFTFFPRYPRLALSQLLSPMEALCSCLSPNPGEHTSPSATPVREVVGPHIPTPRES